MLPTKFHWSTMALLWLKILNFYTLVVAKHSRDTTILIVQLWFNFVQYSSLFRTGQKYRTDWKTDLQTDWKKLV